MTRSTHSLPSETVAWCAGVIDVLGLVKTRTMETGSELASVTVSSPQLGVLERLAELTGTSVVMVHRDYKRLGCGEHCTEAHQHVHSTTGRWSLTGSRALVFLAAIEEHLQTKREDASKALAVGVTAPRKDVTAEKMYRLGWPRLEEESR